MAGSFKLSIKIGIPWASFNEATRGLINAALHEHSPELAAFELENIRERTPVRYGALKEAASARSYKQPTSRQLVKLYYDDEPQLFEWKRVYAPYQEFLPVGLSTYTPNKAQMLYHVHDRDANQIQEWAQRVAGGAIEEWTIGAQLQADAEAALIEQEAMGLQGLTT